MSRLLSEKRQHRAASNMNVVAAFKRQSSLDQLAQAYLSYKDALYGSRGQASKCRLTDSQRLYLGQRAQSKGKSSPTAMIC